MVFDFQRHNSIDHLQAHRLSLESSIFYAFRDKNIPFAIAYDLWPTVQIRPVRTRNVYQNEFQQEFQKSSASFESLLALCTRLDKSPRYE